MQFSTVGSQRRPDDIMTGWSYYVAHDVSYWVAGG